MQGLPRSWEHPLLMIIKGMGISVQQFQKNQRFQQFNELEEGFFSRASNKNAVSWYPGVWDSEQKTHPSCARLLIHGENKIMCVCAVSSCSICIMLYSNNKLRQSILQKAGQEVIRLIQRWIIAQKEKQVTQNSL